MSANYTLCQSLKGRVFKEQPANGTVILGQGGIETTGTLEVTGAGSHIWSKGRIFKVLSAQVLINTAATEATQSFQVQLSDSAGAWGSPTTLATVTITSGNAAGSQLETAVAASSTDVDNSNGTNLYAVRVVHVATATDASLNYDYEVIYTYTHC